MILSIWVSLRLYCWDTLLHNHYSLSTNVRFIQDHVAASLLKYSLWFTQRHLLLASCLPQRPQKLELCHLQNAVGGEIADGGAAGTVADPTEPDAMITSPLPHQTKLRLKMLQRRFPSPLPLLILMPLPTPIKTKTPRPILVGYVLNLSSTTPCLRATIGRATCVRCGYVRYTRN